jgi:polyhydroxyalkanoate synthesis regulator protein
VTDSKSSLDITAQVLTQIILELETDKLDSFPVPLLVRLIRVNDQLVKDFIEKYFNQALHSFLDYQHQVEERLREVHGLPSVYPAVSAWTKAMLQPFTAAFGTELPSAPTGPASPEQTAELHQLIKALQEQVAAKKAVPSSKKAKGARKRTRPAK